MKKLTTAFILAVLLLAPVACSGNTETQAETQSASAQDSQTEAVTLSNEPDSLDNSDEVESSLANIPAMAVITLQHNSIRVDGSGVAVNGNTATITSAGSYTLSGILENGQIIVDTDKEGIVELILNGVDISNSSSAPIFVSSADEVIINLADGSENTVTDGVAYVFANADTDEPDAAIFAKSDLMITGSGTLTVNANYKDGITSKDILEIVNGIITVNTVADGIKGKDSVLVLNGTLTINSGSDGIQTTNDSNEEKGTVTIAGGTIDITSGLDGIQAETNLLISGGDINILSGGGSANSSSQENWGNPGGGRGMGMENSAADSIPLESSKALKAGLDITISAGSINIDSSDDALNSNDSITIDGGDILISSGDDGMHADTSLIINSGNITIRKSYEGLESAAITLNGGNTNLVASDDGINVAGGNDGSSVNGRPGQNNFGGGGDYNLTINGGYIVVDAGGDGLDANGSIEMRNGTVIVNGPTNSGNGPVDYLGTFNITGGYILAVGSSGMAQSASADSSRYSVLYNYDNTQAAGTLIHIENQSGEDILTFNPSKDYQSLLFASSKFENGETYTLYSGGTSSGDVRDGLYSGGTYSGGSQVVNFTISSTVTSLGTAGTMPGGGGGGGRGGGPGGGGQAGMQPSAQ